MGGEQPRELRRGLQTVDSEARLETAPGSQVPGKWASPVGLEGADRLPMAAFSSPLLRLVLVVLVMVGALAAGMVATSAFTGWLFLGVAFVGAPVAAMVDGWARN